MSDDGAQSPARQADSDTIDIDIDRVGTDDDDTALFRRLRDGGSRRVRNQIVERHMGLAAHIAKRFARGQTDDDIRQVAMLGLVKAVDRFDPEHGAAFGSFAGLTIEGEIKRHFRDKTWTVRVPRRAKELHLLVRNAGDELATRDGKSPSVEELAAHIGVDREDVLRGLSATAAYKIDSIDTPTREDNDKSADRQSALSADESGFAEMVDRHMVEQLLDVLPSRERRIVELRFFGEKSQREIAVEVGVSQMHVSRLLRNSFQQMRASEQERSAASGPLGNAEPDFR